MRRVWIIVAVVSLSFSGCAESSPEGSSDDQAAESRCQPVGEQAVKDLAAQLKVDGGGTLRNAQAVRSSDFENAFFISADIQGPGLEAEDDIGTWVSNALIPIGSVYSVNEVAKEFSDWPDGTTTDAGFSMSDDGAEESADCVSA